MEKLSTLVAPTQVAVIGAGPYGLATAAHLRAAGMETRVLGEPMDFWRRQMPSGMLLRSSWDASHISDPQRSLSLDVYQATRATPLTSPLPRQDFVRYGEWFQRQAVPDLDLRKVVWIEPRPNGFRLFLEGAEPLDARRVVIATGIATFAYRPPEFEGLPYTIVSHTSDHTDLRKFAGRQVIVVGSGQSAFESAALLHEDGADVQILARAPAVRWLGRGERLRHQPKAVRYLFYPPSDVGPPGLNWIVALPDLFKRLPLRLQERIAYRSIRPAVASWLQPRVQGIPVTTGRQILSAALQNGRVRLRLDDGTERDADHVLLGTGYRVDVSRLGFLTREILQQLHCVDGYPTLTAGFESSVPGLYFVGAPAARTFGPLMRFVAGTGYTAATLACAMVSSVCHHRAVRDNAFPIPSSKV
jgi:FAD-dependent urate hydroxylase